ncbi:c-type cytochrome [Campylobacter geochelonis]|uniref:Cytochrome c oxidase subunit III n=1 Tax=Campylobacter geochelonis TaxID=1780362 RepID=A0A128EFS7_9BACT|nr:c-type cytochrome [Campylobacter geochelonis]QKF71979.1 cytochrome c oxidase CcoNOPQ, cbb3-type, membrane-bound monoheme cytochrome c subunit III [Campylobacter geochelonis]CZE47754.1 cytochrome c oxidase%2C Cbb3-type subunit III [Campylobacter geochelonis]CZE48978.1 cytochrome c oxidase%2C Cbb3-type subunit III [Campylobacter geochelonis]CZE49937.1 cytochrome c oxidase%2C Cbb3-type subunit III [Campylobacter geochelonis]
MKWFNLQDNINMLTILSAIALLVLTFVIVGLYMKKMKEKRTSSESEMSGESYDGIGEYKNSLPVGWALSYIALIVWALYYFLVGYPLNSYSQVGEYNDEVKAYNAKFESKFANPDQQTLHAMGEGIYLVQCSQCHGITGNGIDGKAANLEIWGSEAGILDAIVKGSKGMNYPLGEMPADMVDTNSAKAIAAFVAKEISAIKTTANESLVEEGRAQWGVCAACHGDDGKGMDGQAPDLTKYGSLNFVVDVLAKGKHGLIGEMPAFNDGRLTDVQKRAVGEYVISLSKNR